MFDLEFSVELTPNGPPRIEPSRWSPKVPPGMVWWIMKMKCLDRPSPDFKLAVQVNTAQATEVLASTLCDDPTGKELERFKMGLLRNCTVRLDATPCSPVKGPTNPVRFVLEIQEAQSHYLSD